MTTQPEMTKEELRKFGLVTGALVIVLIGTLVPWLWDRSILSWQKITGPVGGTLLVWALLHPSSLVLVYKPWMAFAEKIGWVNTRIILAILFFFIIMPIGVVMRFFGHDAMHRKFEPATTSYRHPRTPEDKSHMENPY